MARPVPPPVAPDTDARPALALVGTVTARIRALRPSLSPTGARIGDAVLAAPAEIVGLTVSELADRTDTSVGSVVRFCQDNLGLKGFHDLKLRLAAETAPSADAGVQAPGTPTDTVRAVLAAATAGLEQLPGSLDYTVLAEIVRLLRRAERVLVAGVGTSAPIAADAGYRLRMLGVRTEVLTDPHQQHLAARTLGPPGMLSRDQPHRPDPGDPHRAARRHRERGRHHRGHQLPAFPVHRALPPRGRRRCPRTTRPGSHGQPPGPPRRRRHPRRAPRRRRPHRGLDRPAALHRRHHRPPRLTRAGPAELAAVRHVGAPIHSAEPGKGPPRGRTTELQRMGHHSCDHRDRDRHRGAGMRGAVLRSLA